MAKLLVVEDDESVRQLAARGLERAGHRVDIACDGEEGLRKISEANGGYDLVVSDIRMPVMDGIEMSHQAAARFPGIRIMLVTRLCRPARTRGRTRRRGRGRAAQAIHPGYDPRRGREESRTRGGLTGLIFV